MGSALLELPDECICLILSFLGPSQVKRVSLTFNRRLFAIAKPLLEPLTKIKQDEAYFESLFGTIDLDAFRTTRELDEDYLQSLNFTDLPISIPSSLSHHLEHLDLKGDLSWFEDIAKEDHRDFAGENGRVSSCDADGKDLEKLMETTTRLGLTLPQSFIKLLKSEHLLEKLPTNDACHVDLSPLLKMRIQLKDDPTRHEDSYVFTWLSDQQGCGYKHMYLDTAGRHAVLASDVGPVMTKEESAGIKEYWLDLTDVEKREGIDAIDYEMVGDFVLEDADFERWLVNHYYAERIGFLHDVVDGQPGEGGEFSLTVPDHMRKHFYKVYTEEGRRMQ